MEGENVENKVKQILGRLLGVEIARLKREASLVRDLGADSSHTVELMFELEDAFDAQISGETAQKLSTVGDVIRFAEDLYQRQRDIARD